ncbi:hypothetical protein P152DRAFT_453623 [Eremomyces bilateralis CBS 781.70]|uniref:ER-bound oxygenase mpaB/mpaB'/Rubber oxygenase catalytic domain-containing protein n=1 Tax=Eremomyces bilateralis CBS 781.70 TaxID=1392243 RepID=A0A6G1GGM1_9PEZI|nr:uncharacterized protein P152DRAFT_453623 [Eremomyces bilateralis CBS 781.70]KAF1817010.1 hypothetical protein P152DRAFT_453623 [Eremomyces bilateralis CBS 781.70]
MATETITTEKPVAVTTEKPETTTTEQTETTTAEKTETIPTEQTETTPTEKTESTPSEKPSTPGDSEKGYPGMQPIVLYDPVKEPHVLKEFVGEPCFFAGGQYAILLQFAHPGLARGSLEHSEFADRILNRLKTTTRFLTACVFGTPEERKAVFGIIHRAHSVVKGDGYYADDPELHKWTAATLFMSLLVVHEAVWGKDKIPQWKVEALFRETSVYATSLRMPTEMWPKTLDDFWVYWNHNIETLEVTHWAKTLMKALMWPKVPFPMSAASPLLRLWTTAFLPERMRNEYELPWTKKQQRLYKYSMGYFRITYRMIPPPIRGSVATFTQWEMRKAVKRIQKTGSWKKSAQ